MTLWDEFGGRTWRERAASEAPSSGSQVARRRAGAGRRRPVPATRRRVVGTRGGR